MAIVYLVCLLLPVCPWLLKNIIIQGNPTFPLLYGIFGGRTWNDDCARVFFQSVAPRIMDPGSFVSGLSGLLEGLLSGGNRMGFGVGAAAIGIAPVVLLLKDSKVRSVCYYLLLGFISWLTLTHWQDRFLLALFPGLCAVGAAAIARLRRPLVRKMVVIAVLVLTLTNIWFYVLVLGQQNALGFLTGQVPRGQWQSRGLPHFQAIEHLNEALDPSRDKVLFVGEARIHGCRIPAVASTVFDRCPLLEFEGSATGAMDFSDRLAQEGFTHVFYNSFEVSRLESMYGLHGWRQGPKIRDAMRTLESRLDLQFSLGERKNGVFVYAIP